MAVPQIAFPLTEDQVKEAHDKLAQHLKGLEAEMRITREMLRILPTFCSHPNTSGKYRCEKCGLAWSSGD